MKAFRAVRFEERLKEHCREDTLPERRRRNCGARNSRVKTGYLSKHGY